MKRAILFASAFATLALAGCHIDMWVQSKPKAQDLNPFFAATSANPSSTRMQVPGTVKFEQAHKDTAFYTGYEDGKLVREFPVPVTKTLIERGKDRFTIFCSHCHGQLGDGQGMIAHRGYNLQRPVATYHTDRPRAMPVGHIFDVITHGYGAMYPFAARIKPQDRWAIAAYVRALQLSQHASPGDLDDATRQALGGAATSAPKNSGPMFVSQPMVVPPASVGKVDPAAEKTPGAASVATQPSLQPTTPATTISPAPQAAPPASTDIKPLNPPVNPANKGGQR
ncbi:MAG: cytochrome c [Armatimonadota bacterium]